MNLRMIRNIAFAGMLVIAGLGAREDVYAASCDDIYGGTTGWLNFVHCGEFFYVGEEIGWFDSYASGACGSYSYYFHYRTTGFDQPAYYSGAYQCY